MRAFRLIDYRGPAALVLEDDVPEPVPGPGEVLIDIDAIGLNMPDLLMTRGQYQHRPQLPAVPGCEVAGTVLTAPAGASVGVGDRVGAFLWQGGYAARACAPLNALFVLPEGMSTMVGAAMMINYHTAYFALVRRGGLQPGERVLVLGAGGGIGSAAVQVAAAMGAEVIAGVADDDQARLVEHRDQVPVVVLAKGFAERVRALSGGGVDVVVDPLGDWLFDESIRALRPEGRVLIIGFAAGAIPQLGTNRLLLRNASAVGVAWGAFLEADPSLVATAGAELSRMYADGLIDPPVGAEFAFDQIPVALEALATGQIPGKGVIVR